MSDPVEPLKRLGVARHRTVDRLYVAARRHGPTAPIWRKRAAILTGAILLGLIALLFAHAADWANGVFLALYGR
jgi:hypothetical protein